MCVIFDNYLVSPGQTSSPGELSVQFVSLKDLPTCCVYIGIQELPGSDGVVNILVPLTLLIGGHSVCVTNLDKVSLVNRPR